MPITITEALADIKTTAKRVDSKRAFVLQYLAQPDGVKDPLEKDGGSALVIQREMQAIADLERRVVHLRRGIQRANEETVVDVGGVSMTIADWLVWRRDVAPKQREFLGKVRDTLRTIRDNSRRNGFNVLPPGGVAEKPQDVVVNVSESELAADIEGFEKTIGDLDGILSLKNATVMIVEV